MPAFHSVLFWLLYEQLKRALPFYQRAEFPPLGKQKPAPKLLQVHECVRP